jgi:methionyl-tRNA formyltransferase
LSGETETGISIMRLSLDMDAGDILLQERFTIDSNETSGTLTERLSHVGAELLVKTLSMLTSGDATSTPQDDDKATFCHMITKKDGRIRWGASALEIHHLVRGAHPWPMAQCLFRGQVCKIHQTSVVDECTDVLPGSVTLVEKDKLLVATGSGQLSIEVFQAPGKKAMSIKDYLRGNKMTPGDQFEEMGDS